MSETPKLLLQKDGPIGWIIFNQPEKRNAVSLEMWQRMPEYVRDLATDDTIRVVVLRGAGDQAFVAGADLSQFKERRRNMAELETFTRNYALTMAKHAPLTLRSAKATVEQLVRPEAERDLAMLEKLIADCFNSQDYQEGVKAFSEKRRPQFQGR